MSSFPFVRHHFLRSGFEIIDCPPLTAQLKNSSDIRMVMDVRDYLTHPTYFDEFIILSGDADFTPVLHRLRAHARRTVIFANDYTAAPYTAISDGEVRESDLIALLLEGQVGAESTPAEIAGRPDAAAIEAIRRDIIADVAAAVRTANTPVPLEVLADRAVRAIGHDKTIGTGWAGAGGFRELLASALPEGLRLSGEPPYVVIDTQRHIAAQPVAAPVLAELNEIRAERMIAAAPVQHMAPLQPAPVANVGREIAAPRGLAIPASMMLPQGSAPAPGYAAPAQQAAAPMQQPHLQAQPSPMQLEPQPARMRAMELSAAPQPPAATATGIQQSITRIHEACQAPPLAPPEYRMLFETMSQEINDNGLIGAQTILNIVQRSQDRGLDIRRDDVRFVLEVVSEADPWFEQGASANLFAGRFRNFVVARCRGQGLNLSADELDLVEAWFAGNAQPAPAVAARVAPPPAPSLGNVRPQSMAAQQPMAAQVAMQQPAASRQAAGPSLADPRQAYWPQPEARPSEAAPHHPMRAGSAPAQVEQNGDDFPRIVRTRLRG